MGYHLDGERSLTSVCVAAMAQFSLDRSKLALSVSMAVKFGIVELV